MVNRKKKGSRGELELVDALKALGHEAHRSQQYCGRGEDASDVICTTLPTIHFECKRTEALRLYPAMEQAINDADEGKIPVVATKKNRSEWLAIMRLDDFINLFPAPPVKEEEKV